jgi:type I restriction enzyme S subunit
MQQLFPREGETQPRLRFPEFQNAGEWETKNLKQLATYTKGFAFKSQDYRTEGVRVIRVSDLGADFIKSDNEKIYIAPESADGYNKWKINSGEIIITTVGSKPEMIDSAVGRGILVSSLNEGLLNQNLLKLEVLSGVNSRFLFCNINTTDYQEFIASISRGNANQANIAVKELMSFELQVPASAEQQRIADCLTSLDDLIAAQTQKLDALKTHKKGLMQQLFPSPEEVEA